MTSPTIDRYSITGKLPSAKQKADIVVIGAGQAGVAAAMTHQLMAKPVISSSAGR